FEILTAARGGEVWLHDDGSVVRIKLEAPSLTSIQAKVNVTREITDADGLGTKSSVIAKINDDGTIIPASQRIARARLQAWARGRLGRDASPRELDAMVLAWGCAARTEVER